MGGAFGAEDQTADNVLHLIHQGGTYRVTDRSVLRNDVRGLAAVEDDVVQTAAGDNVLAQVVGAHIHQLNGVQGAAAQPGSAAGMGGNALEVELHQLIGVVGAAADRVHIGGMVGQAAVQVVEDAGAGHIALTGEVLLRRAGVEAQGTGDVLLLHRVHQRREGQHAGGAQQVVAAGVAVSAGSDRILDRLAGLLAQAGQRIEFTEDTDDRMAAAIFGDEGGLHHINRGGDLGPQALEVVLLQLGGVELAEAGFRLGPDVQSHFFQCRSVLGDVLLNGFLAHKNSVSFRGIALVSLYSMVQGVARSISFFGRK